VDYLKAIDGVQDLEIAGTYPRRKETVGELDTLVTAKRSFAANQARCAYARNAPSTSRTRPAK